MPSVIATERLFRQKSNTTGKAGGLNGERLKGAHEIVSRRWRLTPWRASLGFEGQVSHVTSLLEKIDASS